MIAFRSRIRRITAIIETVFPEPDSPTMPMTSPSASESDSPSTAWTRPFSVRKETSRPRTSRSGEAPSGTTDPRIEQRVDEVDDRIRQDDEEGGVDDRRENHGQVEVLQRVERQLADPVQPEHDLGQERPTSDERSEVEAEEADERDQRRPQRMTEHHPLLRDPLGARGADVVLLLRLDERRAEHARVDADEEHRQGQPRKQERLEPTPRRLRERDVAERRHPREEDRVVKTALRQEVDDLAEPEHRHRDPDQPDDHHRRVDRRASEDGGEQSHADAHHDPDQRRSENERERDGSRLRHLRDNLRTTIHEGRQITGDEQLLHHQRVLDGQWLVEPEVLAHQAQRLLIGVSPRDAGGRVDSGRREEDEERQNTDREEHEHHRHEPPGGEAKHQSNPRSFARGSRESRTPSPSTFSASTVTAIAMPGAMATAGRVYRSPWPSRMIVPQLASGGWTPIDRNESAASVSMSIASMSGKKTIAVVTTLRRMSLQSTRQVDAPSPSAASTNSRRARDRTSPRIGRATYGM